MSYQPKTGEKCHCTMTTPQNMTTEELLENATIDGLVVTHSMDHAKTHSAVLMIERETPEFPHTGKSARFCTVHAETVLMYELEARAELIARAVNSFEALLASHKELLEHAEWSGTPPGYSWDDFGPMFERAVKAQQLADGKQP